MNIPALHANTERGWLGLLASVVTMVMFISSLATDSHAAGGRQKSFLSPDEAVTALVAAIRADDEKEMLVILGPGGRELLSSGDSVADRAGRAKFIKAYEQRNSLEAGAARTMILHIGADDWPMPIPIVKKGAGWVFDIAKGRKEILNRRIGRNELQVIEVIDAYVGAQHEYASKDCRGGGRVEFAQRLISTPGSRDGLYWEAREGEEDSPLGPLIARAAREGYTTAGSLSPFHGYYFKVLRGQGPHASGGRYNYLVKGKMILGFGLVAYPAEYGNSGVMTFMVNQEGIIYEKNLGKGTRRIAEGMTVFNPNRGWKKVNRPELSGVKTPGPADLHRQ